MYQQPEFDSGNGKPFEPGYKPYGNMVGMKTSDADGNVTSETPSNYYKKQGQFGEYSGQSIDDIRSVGAFDYTNENYVGSYAMDQIGPNSGKVRIQQGEFFSSVDPDSKEGRKYLQETYSKRYKTNSYSKRNAIENEMPSYQYTDPHTGELRTASSGYEGSMPSIDVTPQMQANRDSNSSGQSQSRSRRLTPEERRLNMAKDIKGSALSNRQSIRISKGGNKAARQRNRLQRQADRRERRAARRSRRGRY